MPFFTTSDQVQIRYETAGNPKNKPLILSNSLGTRLEMWDVQMEAFTKEYYVVRYDKRGHGLSHVKQGPTDFNRLSRDAVELLDHLQLQKAHWCGLSMGGMSGLWNATHHAERFDKFALTCTSPMIGSPDLYNGRIKSVREKGMKALRPLVIDRWFTRGFQAANVTEMNRVGEMVETTSPEGYISACGALRDMDQRETMRSIKAKVLVIAGTHDEATPPAHGRLIAESIKGAQYVELNGAHLSNIEASDAYTQAVLNFLRA
jgi:3-oxoadipate enol-lactonase